MKEINRIILDTFSVGDEIIITKEIKPWSSTLNPNYHCQSKITYPYKLKILKIKYEAGFVSMTEGRFGWSLTSLVEQGAVSITKFNRVKKLKRIKELSI